MIFSGNFRSQVFALGVGVVVTAPAFAWSENATRDWVARNDAIIAAVEQPIDPEASAERVLHSYPQQSLMFKPTPEMVARGNAGAKYIDNIKAACSGLTGEHIKNGGRNMPTWAQTTQQRFCLSASDLAHAFGDDAANKDRCKSLKSAIDNASKATKGEDPDAVVDSAARLIAAAKSLSALPIIMHKKSLGGAAESSRTFACD